MHRATATADGRISSSEIFVPFDVKRAARCMKHPAITQGLGMPAPQGDVGSLP